MSKEDALEDLQTRLAFQEDLIEKLDHRIAEQEQELAVVKEQLKHIYKKLLSVEQGVPSQEGSEPPPPHY